MRKGRFFCFVGIDGSGKTTQAKILLDYLNGQKKEAIYVWARRESYIIRPLVALAKAFLKERVPSEGADYMSIKAKRKKILLRWPLVQKLWVNLALQDYLLQLTLKVTLPLLAGKILIVDRYLPDMFADFIANLDLDLSQARRFLRNPLLRLFPRPNAYLYLRVPPFIGFARKSDGTSLEYLKERSKIYDFLTEEIKMITIDATEEPDKVTEKVLDVLKGRI